MYYVLGIVGYKKQDPSLVGVTLTWVFFASMAIFVLVAIAVFYKVKYIFGRIMHNRKLWRKTEESNNSNPSRNQETSVEEEEEEDLAAVQMNLFWGGSPKMIITAIQFMQFGYALFLSVVIIFWDTIHDGNVVGIYWYLVAIAVCYTLFVFVAAHVIPRYTLCTSLAQLVDAKRLNETVAQYHLDQAKRQKAHQEYFGYDDNGDHSAYTLRVGTHPEQPQSKTVTPSIVSATPSLPSELSSQPNIANSHHLTSLENVDQAADIVSMRTEELRQIIAAKEDDKGNDHSIPDREESLLLNEETNIVANRPDFKSAGLADHSVFGHGAAHSIPVQSLSRDERHRLRRLRRKAQSDGVAAMSAMTKTSNESQITPFGLSRPATPKRIPKPSFVPEPIQEGKSHTGPHPPILHSTTFDDQQQEKALADRRKLRRERRKTVSDGVAVMAAMNSSETLSMHPNPTHTSFQTAKDDSLRIADLVNVDTASLRQKLSDRERQQLEVPSARQRQLQRRTNRRKAASEGVAAMAAMSTTTESFVSTPLNATNSLTGSQSGNTRRKTRSNSDPKQMKELLSNGQTRNMEDQSNMNASTLVVGEKAEQPQRKRPNRMKTVSDGVQFMANSTMSFFTPSTSSVAASNALGDTSTIEKSVSFAPHSFAQQQEDNASVESHASSSEDDDNLSDIDDIPIIDSKRLSMLRRTNSEKHKERESLKSRLATYFTSKSYVVTSNVFGTMIAFFLVGSRVERFLHTEHIVPGDFISFDFSESVTFWMLSVWFFFFLVMDGLCLFTIDRFAIGRKYRSIWLSAAIDAVITTTCWIVFWVAETQRCCDDSTLTDEYSRVLLDRSLGTESTQEKGYDTYYDDEGPAPCSCTTFGSRLYGGLGTLEPYVSLISLRLARFFVARSIVSYQDKRRGIKPTALDKRVAKSREVNLDPFNVHENSTTAGDHDDHGDHDHVRGTAAELWEKAVADHPEVVATYGMFSVEILHAMLGLPVNPEPVTKEIPKMKHIGTPRSDTGSNTGYETLSEGDERDRISNHRESFKLGKEFSSKLSVDAQAIIMAGKLGKTVKSVPNLQVLGEEAESADQNKLGIFQITDDISHAPAVDFDQLGEFDAPDARLVRSMRRCDRKFVPLLNKWAAVDVVVTRFEMVYFDASDSIDYGTYPQTEAILEAMKATKGGKGLRLKDVAAGRKVVGHLLLSDVCSVAIERYMPDDDFDDAEGPEETVTENEFWKRDALHFSRQEAWNGTIQDTLAIHTVHGQTLYLRFYSDLEDAEQHPDQTLELIEYHGDDDNVPIIRNNAFQWVQTIGRFCGPEQLQQSLPHFGSDNVEEELRDYLVVHPEKTSRRHHFLATHGKHLRNGETVAAALRRRGPQRNLSIYRRPANEIMPSVEEGSERDGSIRRLFGRSQSIGLEEERDDDTSNHSPTKSRSRRNPFKRANSSPLEASDQIEDSSGYMLQGSSAPFLSPRGRTTKDKEDEIPV